MVGLDRKSHRERCCATACRWNDEQEGRFKVASQMASSANLPNATTMLSNKISLYVSIIIWAVLYSQ